jgi:hypothetical protein
MRYLTWAFVNSNGVYLFGREACVYAAKQGCLYNNFLLTMSFADENSEVIDKRRM